MYFRNWFENLFFKSWLLKITQIKIIRDDDIIKNFCLILKRLIKEKNIIVLKIIFIKFALSPIKTAMIKENIMKILNNKSTVCRHAFYGLNKLKHLKVFMNRLTLKSDFKNSEIATNNVLILPMHYKLSRDHINKICKKILDYYKKKKDL